MARTKEAIRPQKKSSSNPQESSSTPDAAPNPVPQALSQADREKLRLWLDSQDKPFSVATAGASLKRKRDGGMSVQKNLWEERLNVKYEVRPKAQWDALRRYKRFTIGSESIANGQYILVKHDDSEDAPIDIDAQWKAQVLDVRALDGEHVYIRVAWLNRPEDLRDGRMPWHGKNELIPSNELDVIDARSVNGTLKVVHWDEEDDSAPMEEDEFFWRQTFDFANSKTMSSLRKICIDKAPQNPDEMILQCGSEECRKWMHVKCIAESAVQHASDDARETNGPLSKRIKLEDIDSKATPVASATSSSNITADLMIKGSPIGEDQTPAKETEILITNEQSGDRYSQPVTCLFCRTEIEWSGAGYI